MDNKTGASIMKTETEFNKVTGTSPRKRILLGSVLRTKIEDVFDETEDNIIDHVSDLLDNNPDLLPEDKKVVTHIEADEHHVEIKWNLGIPRNKRAAMLTPGLQDQDKSEGQIGAFAMGQKVANMALGRDITIETVMPDETEITIYHYPHDWFWTETEDYNETNGDDWKVPTAKRPRKGANQYTRIHVSKPLQKIREDFNEEESERGEKERLIREHLGKTYGLTIDEFKGRGVTLEIWLNGQQVSPAPQYGEFTLKDVYIRPPGFEPVIHRWSYEGVQIKFVVGALRKIDRERARPGIFCYGNRGRMFEEAFTSVDFFNPEIDIAHPQKKIWQGHLFFDGDPLKIPWRAPTKRGLDTSNAIVKILRRELIKAVQPFVTLGGFAIKDVRAVYTETYVHMDNDSKRDTAFPGEDDVIQEERWNKLPETAQNGIPFSSELVETWDHGELSVNETRWRRDEPKFNDRKAKAFKRDLGLKYENTSNMALRQHLAFAGAMLPPEAATHMPEPPAAPQTGAHGAMQLSPTDSILRAEYGARPADVSQGLEALNDTVLRLMHDPRTPAELVRGKSTSEFVEALWKRLFQKEAD